MIHVMERISGKCDKDKRLAQLGAAIRSRRQALELSQEELADSAELDRSHMGKIERGERNVTILNVLRIAHAMRCRPSELLSDAGL